MRSTIRTPSIVVVAAIVALLIGGSNAAADLILDTGSIGGPFGFFGYDVSRAQSVGLAFVPAQNYTLDDISLWIMSNDFTGPGRTYTVSLRTDNGGGPSPTIPSSIVLESWNVATSAVGFSPVLETQPSILHPLLNAGTPYWVVAESNEPPGLNPVWVIAQSVEFVSLIDFVSSPTWQPGGLSGAAGTIIRGTVVPEPWSALSALIGMALIGALRLRKR